MKFLQCLVSNHRKDLTSYLFSVRFKFTTFHSQRISSLNRVEITSPLSIIYKNVLISSKSQTCQPPKVAQLYLHDARRHPGRGGRARDRHRHRPLLFCYAQTGKNKFSRHFKSYTPPPIGTSLSIRRIV